MSIKVIEGGKIATVLGPRSSFVGTLEFDRPLQIKGQFQGEIVSGGTILIDETANVKANIKAAVVVLGGELRGNIDATDKVEILPTGRLYGNVRAPKLKIADGVVFEGNCEMLHT